MAPVKLAHVARYHELDICVHPLCPSDHLCPSPGKIPFDPIAGYHMSQWQHHDQFSLDEWQEWLDYDSSINIGMLTGRASSLVGVDIDDEAGDAMVREQWDGETWEYSTGKGRRLLFRHTEPISRSRVEDIDGRSFEVLGDATNNVLPPSEHHSGRFYTWTPGRTPLDIEEPPELPSWALARTTKSGEEISSDMDDVDWVKFAVSEIVKGRRNDSVTRLAGRLMGPAPLTPNETYMILLLINRAYGKPPLQDAEIKAVVKSINRAEMMSTKVRKSAIYDIKEKYGCLTFEQAERIWRDQQ